MRVWLIAMMLVLTPGCLRTKFDLCAQDPPDPNCAYLDAQNASGDAGVDAAVDVGADVGAMDASTGG
jgi:hypothetical protein